MSTGSEAWRDAWEDNAATNFVQPEYIVYGDACNWETTVPETPATTVDEMIEPGATGQRGFANVASGRIVGTQVDLEWVDVPLGDTVNGGGLTFTYDQGTGQLTLTEQRGGREPFGGTVLTRIDSPASPAASPSPSASP